MLQVRKSGAIVVFIDELPWMDTHKSRFTKAFELFWNSWGADQDNLMIVVCGSATAWMTDKLLGNKGGLHNRVTRQIRLAPFSLGETSEFLRARGMLYTPYQVAECYMIMGGTPYYLNLLQKGYSQSSSSGSDHTGWSQRKHVRCHSPAGIVPERFGVIPCLLRLECQMNNAPFHHFAPQTLQPSTI